MVLNQVATLQELDTHYSIIDLLEANEALDVKEEMEYLAAKQGQQRADSGRM